jgi:hypothetical protein
MIDDLDASFSKMLRGEAPAGAELGDSTKTVISFGVPDADWRRVQTNKLVLNAYLYRVVEDVEVRSTERRLTHNPDGTVTKSPFPARVECSYLITAWNLATDTGGEEKEKREHRLLAQALYVLLRNSTLPSGYLSGALSPTQEIDLPIISARSDEMGGATSDFWSGLSTAFRPSITCKITLAIDLAQAVSGPMVTTTHVTYSAEEESFAIGGTVRGGDGTPVPNAWVVLDSLPALFVTDANGRFQIDSIRSGSHTLTARAAGFLDGSRDIQVPEPSGNYDLVLGAVPSARRS